MTNEWYQWQAETAFVPGQTVETDDGQIGSVICPSETQVYVWFVELDDDGFGCYYRESQLTIV